MLTRRKFLATTACTMAAAYLRAQAQGKVKVALSIPSSSCNGIAPDNDLSSWQLPFTSGPI